MIIESSNVVKAPIISVMVMAYNHKDYIRQCLSSILNQVINVPYELVLCEDSSIDGTQEICKEYQSRYPEIIRLNLNEVNIGLIKNYRKALSLCRGKYIAQLAGDDFWCDKYKLQKQFDALEAHAECDLCYTNCYTCNQYGVVDKTPLIATEPETFEHHLLNTGYIAPCSWMFRRKVLDYMELQDWFTDESLALALDVLHHSKLYFINEPTYVYRVHQNSAASQTDPKKMWKYVYGLIKIQMYYADKYKMPEEFIEKMKIQEYHAKCFAALEAGDEAFVEEGIQYCKEHGIILKWYVDSCRAYVSYKQQYYRILSSKAYRIGKVLLKPFKWLRKNSAHN